MSSITDLKKNNPKAYAALFSLLIALILLITWWQISLAYEDQLIVREREIITSDLAHYANSFTNALDHRLALVQGLHSFIITDSSPHRLEREFDLFAAGLYESTPGIRNLASAPGGIQTYVYPYLTNKATLGHDLLNDTRPSVIEENKKLLSGQPLNIRGPIELRQGGEGLVITKAVFLNGTWETGTFWGFTSMVIDLPPVYNETGLTASDIPYDIALKNDDWGVFFGEPVEFDENNPVINMTIGYETWQMAGCPTGGWGSLIAGDLSVFRLLSFLVVIIITALCYLILIGRLTLGRMVEKKTHDLLESEERFRVFFNENPNPCYMISVDGSILNINTTALNLLGYTYKELIGKSLNTIYAPESWDDAKKAFEKWNRDGSLHNQELAILSKDGNRRQVLLNVEKVTDSEGKTLHSLSVQTDITALREVEAESHEREVKYKRLFTHMVEGSALQQIIYDENNVPVDYSILEVNPAFENILGLTSADVVGKTAREAYLGDKAPYLDIYSRVAETNVPETFETFFESMGKYFSISVYSPKVGYFVTIFSDITKRHQSEEELRESEYKYHEIFDNINEAVFLHEVMSDNSRGHFMEVNDVGCRRLGYSREELLKLTVKDINSTTVRKEDPDRVLALKAGKEISFNAEHVRKDGSVFPVHVNARMIEFRDRQFILSIVRDMTEEYEARNREAVALRQIEQNLTQLAILNDEIRNPLAVITGIVDMSADEEVAAPVLEQVRAINDIVNRLDRGWLESEKIREYLRKYHDIL